MHSAVRPALAATIDDSSRASTEVTITCDLGNDRTARLFYDFRNAGHRAKAKEFAASVQSIDAQNGAALVVALDATALNAMAPLARGEMRFAAEVISAFPK